MTVWNRSQPALALRAALLLGLVGLIGCAAPRDPVAVRVAGAQTDLDVFRTRAPQITAPVTLRAALAYADRYNIELWVARREHAYQRELTTHARLKLLPEITLGAESSRRNQFDAAASVSLESGNQSVEPSYSAEKERETWDLSATWDVLDFGISYFRARQQWEREQIAAERLRRARQNLAFEVTQAYWHAVAARDIAQQAAALNSDVQAMQTAIAEQIAQQTISEIDGLKRETTLLEQLADLAGYEQSYQAALAELASLMGLPPGSDLTLADAALDQPVERLTFDLPKLEQEALICRPELYEQDAQGAISRDEVRIALARMFPSIVPFWGYYNDNNDYLVFNHWNAAGLRASWNLLALPQQWQERRALQERVRLADEQRIALAIGVLTQLHLAVLDYQRTGAQYSLTRTIAEKHAALVNALQQAAVEGTAHAGETTEQRLKALRARAKYLTQYANLMVAYARVLNTVGRDVVPAAWPVDPATTLPAEVAP